MERLLLRALFGSRLRVCHRHVMGKGKKERRASRSCVAGTELSLGPLKHVPPFLRGISPLLTGMA